MKETFRQCMAWLHTWTGLIAGWVLFFVFLTGTFAYVSDEVSHWMRPEEPMMSALPPATDLLTKAEQRLCARAPGAETWFIGMPGGRAEPALSIRWRDAPAEGADRAGGASEILDVMTGQPLALARPRETGGGQTLYWMHFFLHYLPQDAGIRVVGICSMIMLVAILTGVVTHKKIFRDFFTFRPRRGQRSWLDGHNLLGVTALPFHVMITWSGLIFYLFAYMPVALHVLYPDPVARAEFNEYAYGVTRADLLAARRQAVPPGAPAALRPTAPRASLAPMMAHAEAAWGIGNVSNVIVHHPGRDDAHVTFNSRDTLSLNRRHPPQLRFDGVTGQVLPDDRQAQAWPVKFNSVMLALHEAHFAGPLLRALFVCAGLLGTGMIATGLLLWSAKRKAKMMENPRPHFGIAVVDVMNAGTIAGLPLGIAAYFWANRLLPVGMDDRGAWEMHSIFITWGATFIFAVWRPRAWSELWWLAAGAYGLIPVINALTTDRHLGITVSAGDWVLAGFDISAFATAVIFALIARAASPVTRGAVLQPGTS